MATGLFLAALANIFFGLSGSVAVFGFWWMLNGWFQGMGFPPCARLLTHWFPPKQLATKMSIWNASHTLGAGFIVVLGGYLAPTSWRLCFLVPAAIAICCAFYVLRNVPDTPPAVGLPEAEGTESSHAPGKSEDDFKTVVMEKVFRNPYVWLISLANFFVYTIRYAVLDWGPSLLTQAKHIHITHAGWMVAAFEFSGAFGSVLAGWLTDRFFAGRAAWACVIFMAFTGISILAFWLNPFESEWLNAGILCCAGFFIYGPQCMVGAMAANLGTKRAAASAVGLTGLFGYASTLLSGVGLGALVQHRGWDDGFKGLLIVSVIGTLLFVLALGAKADGYAESAPAEDSSKATS
jgi:OPA family glycerol-3-phosphate transporter-like MFS transporter/OPA family sugar phosphate sensor protein UhpC-like MFS transporter